QPDNPYFWELKGQALYENSRVRDAVGPLQKAVQLAPQSGLIRMLYGQALVAAGNNEAAVRELQAALAREPSSVLGHRSLAMAYGRMGRNAEADLASAQAAFHEGNLQL